MKQKYYQDEDVIGEFYKALSSEDEISLKRIHIPRSDVFYLKAHLEDKFQKKFTLDYVERIMYLEGMLLASDVFEPNNKRSWE